MADPLDWVPKALDALEAQDLRRHLRHRSTPAGRLADGLVNLSSNDYLDLAGDPRVRHAAADAAREWGAGAGASRLITGGTTLHRDLEAALARWKGAEDAVVFSSGYLANLGTVGALAGPGDVVCSDALNHASIIDACRLSRAAVEVYDHNDPADLRRALSAHPGARRRLVVTDGIFSMDGDAANLPELCDVAESYGAMVMVDDAHGCGVIGPNGRGTAAAQGAENRVTAAVGTLSKSFGAAGGYVTGSAALCEWLRNRARGFVFDTAPPPATVAAALAALEIAVEEPQRRQHVTQLARRLAGGLRMAAPEAVPIAEPAAAVVPFVLGSAERALRVAKALEDAGFLVTPIRPPTVPAGTSRLRFAVTAACSETDIDGAVLALAEAASAVAPGGG